jgi:hypothetical protein
MSEWQGPVPANVGTVMEWDTTADGKAVAVPTAPRGDSRKLPADVPPGTGRFRQLVRGSGTEVLYNVETHQTLIRVSNWVDPEALDVMPDDDGKSMSVRVSYRKGRFTYYGKVDRNALNECRKDI